MTKENGRLIRIDTDEQRREVERLLLRLLQRTEMKDLPPELIWELDLQHKFLVSLLWCGEMDTWNFHREHIGPPRRSLQSFFRPELSPEQMGKTNGFQAITATVGGLLTT